MVSTRSRSALHSGDGAGAAAKGQPEVTSTPRRASSRLAKASTPSARARPSRAANKLADLDAIAEEVGKAHAESPGALQHVAQPQQPGDIQPQEGQQMASAEPSASQQEDTAGTAVGVAGGSGESEGCISEGQGSEEEGEGEAEGERREASPAGPGLSSRATRLAADAGLLNKVALEMFAALEGLVGGDQGGGSSGSGSDGKEGESEEEGEMGEGGGASGQDEEEGVQELEAGVDGVPRHLRWEPELMLPGMGERAGASQQQRAQARQQQQQHLAKQLHAPPRDERALQRAQRGSAPDTAGKQWFDLPATAITEEVKRDLRMLRLRTAFDPKAFYKKLDSSKFPKHFQVGTVVEGAADFYSGRLTKGQRKRTFTEEVMADPHLAEVRKKRFNKLQEERSYWANKKAARKTENERLKKKPRKPKH